MHRIFLNFQFVALSTLLAISVSHSAENPEAMVAKHVLSMIQEQLDIEGTAIDGAVQAKVFSCTFFHAKPWLKHADGTRENWSNYLLAANGDAVDNMAKPHNLHGNPKLVDCLQEGFAVTSEADATDLINDLEGVISDSSSSFNRRVAKSENGWLLITGDAYTALGPGRCRFFVDFAR